MTGTLRGNLRTFIEIPRRILLKMRNLSDKICSGIQNTHFVFNNFSPPPPFTAAAEIRAVYDIIRKHMVDCV